MWAALSAVALCAVFGAVLGFGQAVAVRHRAGTAADLAVLAAADHALEGERRACARARRVAEAQAARVVRCAVRGEIADLVAQVRWGPYGPRVRSRAGPVDVDVDADPGRRGAAPSRNQALSQPQALSRSRAGFRGQAAARARSSGCAEGW